MNKLFFSCLLLVLAVSACQARRGPRPRPPSLTPDCSPDQTVNPDLDPGTGVGAQCRRRGHPFFFGMMRCDDGHTCCKNEEDEHVCVGTGTPTDECAADICASILLGSDCTDTDQGYYCSCPAGTNDDANRCPESCTMPPSQESSGVRMNLADMAAATQSSTAVNGAGDPLSADRATDGDYSTASFTQFEANPWIQVDLGAMHCITSVLIVNRVVFDTNPDADEIFARAKDLTVHVAMDETEMADGTAEVCGTVTGALGASKLVMCPTPITGRYVRVSMAATDLLHLAAVEVFGI